jgi:hypothetical protein
MINVLLLARHAGPGVQTGVRGSLGFLRSVQNRHFMPVSASWPPSDFDQSARLFVVLPSFFTNK